MAQVDISYEIASGPRPSVAGKLRLPSVRARSLGRRWLERWLLGWIVPAALLALWTLAFSRHWVAPQILPGPARVARTLLDQAHSGDLFRNFAISLGRVAGGFALGGFMGVALGAAMGLSRRLEDYLYPTFQAFSQVPVLGWVPLFMMILGIGEALKVVLIALASFVPIALNVLKGIRNVPRSYFDVARVFRFSRGKLLRKVVFPATVPALFVGLRYGLTQAWLSLVTVELLASSEGLGFMIVWGRQLFQLDLVLAAILVVGVVGLLLDQLLGALEARLLRWRPEAHWAATPAREIR